MCGNKEDISGKLYKCITFIKNCYIYKYSNRESSSVLFLIYQY